MLLQVTSTLDWMKGNRHRFLTYLRNLRSGDFFILFYCFFKSPDRRLLPARLSSLKKVDLWALDSVYWEALTVCDLRPKMSLVDTLLRSQWCNQDAFEAPFTRIPIFVKTYIFPVICKSLKPCISKECIYIPNWQISLASFCCSIFLLRFPKRMHPYVAYSNCFRPFSRKSKNDVNTIASG